MLLQDILLALWPLTLALRLGAMTGPFIYPVGEIQIQMRPSMVTSVLRQGNHHVHRRAGAMGALPEQLE